MTTPSASESNERGAQLTADDERRLEDRALGMLREMMEAETHRIDQLAASLKDASSQIAGARSELSDAVALLQDQIVNLDDTLKEHVKSLTELEDGMETTAGALLSTHRIAHDLTDKQTAEQDTSQK